MLRIAGAVLVMLAVIALVLWGTIRGSLYVSRLLELGMAESIALAVVHGAVAEMIIRDVIRRLGRKLAG